MRVRQRRRKSTIRALLADRRLGGEIKVIVFSKAGQVVVRQPSAGDIEYAAFWNCGNIPQARGLVVRSGQHASAIGAESNRTASLNGEDLLARQNVPQASCALFR